MNVSSEARFSEDRKQVAMGYNYQLESLYREHWAIESGDIYFVESEHDGDTIAHDICTQIDYAGVDSIVNVTNGLIGVAHRIRPNTRDTVDFSLRYSTGTPYKAEYHTLQQTARNGYLSPSVYAFGIRTDSKPLLEMVYLINIPTLVATIVRGEIDEQGPYPSSGGTQAMYFSIDELDRFGCIQAQWNSDEIVQICGGINETN